MAGHLQSTPCCCKLWIRRAFKGPGLSIIRTVEGQSCMMQEGALDLQDNPLMDAVVEQPGTPILVLDNWEHAY